MVNGIAKFKEYFKGFENQYVIIGGTACDIIMENEELPFRATKDIDIVLIVESITAEFGRKFWEYIKEAKYSHLNKSLHYLWNYFLLDFFLEVFILYSAFFNFSINFEEILYIFIIISFFSLSKSFLLLSYLFIKSK